MKNRVWLLALLLCGELALLSLSHWQWQRYNQRLDEQAEAAARPPSLLHGTYLPLTAALTLQPNPQVPEESGWRLLAVLQTSGTSVVVDRGYATPAFNPDNTPNFTHLQPPSGPHTLRGVWVPLPKRKGWLGGPDVTTHPQLLAFLNPTLLTSGTLTPQQFVLTQPDVTPAQTFVSAPPTRNPLRHLSYCIQWGVMAVVWVLLGLNLWWRQRPQQQAA